MNALAWLRTQIGGGDDPPAYSTDMDFLPRRANLMALLLLLVLLLLLGALLCAAILPEVALWHLGVDGVEWYPLSLPPLLLAVSGGGTRQRMPELAEERLSAPAESAEAMLMSAQLPLAVEAAVDDAAVEVTAVGAAEEADMAAVFILRCSSNSL